MRLLRHRHSALAVALTFSIWACANGTSTGPTVAPVITVTAGGNQSDTIQAPLGTALTVEVHGRHGELATNTGINFTVLAPTSADSAIVQVSAASPVSYAALVSTNTNASGQASVLVQMGTKVGVAHVAVAVPTLNVADTVAFTVKAGAFATNVTIGSADTAIYQGGHVSLAIGLDRFGNPSNGPITVTSISGPVTLDGATATGTAYGIASVSFTVNSTPHTSKITIVPQGRIAAGGDGGIVIFNTDGSQYRSVGQTIVSDLKYSPSGATLALDHWPFIQTSHAYTTDTVTAGTLADLDPSVTSSSDGELFPQFSRDGQWIYFGDYDLTFRKRLWRVHPDGTGSAQVPAVDSANYDDINPSPSPDGTQLVYVVDHGAGSTFLNTLTIATGTVNAINVPGHTPTWAPSGSRIAYIRPPGDTPYGALSVMNADGTSAHTLNTGSYFFTVDWSPDAQWIVAAENPSGRIDLVNASTGLTLPLDFTSNLLGPTWHP